MELLGYMIRIGRFIPNLSEINEEILDILSLFIFNNHLSIYQIHKEFQENGKKMAYKNTHKKVQKLIDFKVIEKETDASKFQKRELERGAKYYKLSEEGIFSLFNDSRFLWRPPVSYVNRAFKNGKTKEDMVEIFHEYGREIYTNHKNCMFFKLFLLPWISIETIENLHIQGHLDDHITTLLTDRCNVIKKQLSNFPQGIFKHHALDQFFEMDYNPRYLDFDFKEGIIKVEDNPALSFLKNLFLLNLEVVKVKKENENRIILCKTDDTKKLLLDFKDEENEINIISAKNIEDRVSLPAYSISQVMIPHSMFESVVREISLFILNFEAVFSLVMGKITYYDLDLFKKDVKFIWMLSNLKKGFNVACELVDK